MECYQCFGLLPVGKPTYFILMIFWLVSNSGFWSVRRNFKFRKFFFVIQYKIKIKNDLTAKLLKSNEILCKVGVMSTDKKLISNRIEQLQAAYQRVCELSRARA